MFKGMIGNWLRFDCPMPSVVFVFVSCYYSITYGCFYSDIK